MCRPSPSTSRLPFVAKFKSVPIRRVVFDDPTHGEDFLLLCKFNLSVTNYRNPHPRPLSPCEGDRRTPLTLFCGIQPKNDAPLDRFALKFTAPGETQAAELKILAPVEELDKGNYEVQTAVWTADKNNFGGPVAHIRRVPLKLPPTLNVALVKTMDDTVYNALENMAGAGLGMTLSLLSDDDLKAQNLNQYHTIVLDLRATQFRPEVRHIKQRLRQFMEDGGNVVCLYP